jgi:hypothetical protein
MDGRVFSRLAGLAVGLGVAAAFAATPGVASADDMQISIDGMDLFPTAGNTAIAESGMGDIAMAFGNNSFACAGCADSPGTLDFAMASGTGSAADSGFGQFDDAMARGTNSLSDAGAGNFDTAIANGTGSFAEAAGVSPAALGNSDFADAWGTNTTALAGNILSSTIASSNDTAWVLDPFGTVGSSALAGDGNVDLAAVFGDNLTASALGNFMYDLVSAFFNFHN